MKCNENPFIGSPVIARGQVDSQTDVKQLIGAILQILIADMLDSD